MISLQSVSHLISYGLAEMQSGPRSPDKKMPKNWPISLSTLGRQNERTVRNFDRDCPENLWDDRALAARPYFFSGLLDLNFIGSSAWNRIC
jgi:hypothetical protein